MERTFLGIAALLGILAVACGAFGAHALRTRLPADLLAAFQTAVQYHFYHALALGLVAALLGRFPGSATVAAGWCFVGGIGLFSGSLYALALSGVRWLGAVTPLGGLAFLAGWGCLVWAAFREAS